MLKGKKDMKNINLRNTTSILAHSIRTYIKSIVHLLLIELSYSLTRRGKNETLEGMKGNPYMAVTMRNLLTSYKKEVFPSTDKIFFFYIYLFKKKESRSINVDQIDNQRHMQARKKDDDNNNQYPEISIQAHINIKHVSILLFIHP